MKLLNPTLNTLANPVKDYSVGNARHAHVRISKPVLPRWRPISMTICLEGRKLKVDNRKIWKEHVSLCGVIVNICMCLSTHPSGADQEWAHRLFSCTPTTYLTPRSYDQI
jgi:hypothetical protein